jgi:hypothetical protein
MTLSWFFTRKLIFVLVDFAKTKNLEVTLGLETQIVE